MPFEQDSSIRRHKRRRPLIVAERNALADNLGAADAQDRPSSEDDGTKFGRRAYDKASGQNEKKSEPIDEAKKNGDADKDEGSKSGKGDDNDGDGGGSPDENKPRSKKALFIVAIIVVVVLIIGFFFWFAGRNQVSTDDAYTDGDVITMSPKVSGYVTELYVSDNTRVRKGDLILRIDPRDYLAAQAQALAQLAQAQAQLDGAQVAYSIAKVQYPAQLRQAQAQERSAEASAAQAQLSYLRQHAVDKRATTQETIDAANSQEVSSAANVDNAKAQVSVAATVPDQLRQVRATIEQRLADVQAAQAQLQQANLNLSYTEVRAPSDGFITKRNVQLGSYLSVGATMFLIVTPNVWITANFKEGQLGRMRPGDAVDVKVDAYDGVLLHGHVDSIQYGSGSRFSAFPTENATGNFVKIVQRVPVKIVIDSGGDPNAPLPLGLSVSPVVRLP